MPTSAAVAARHNFILWVPADATDYVTAEFVHGAQEIHDAKRVRLCGDRVMSILIRRPWPSVAAAVDDGGRGAASTEQPSAQGSSGCAQ